MANTQDKEPEGYLRIRLGLHDTHYPNGLIPAATILRLFADCASELGIRTDGTDGYLAAYEKAEFFKPVYAGDYIEIRAKRLSKGNRSRRSSLEARRCMETIYRLALHWVPVARHIRPKAILASTPVKELLG